MKVRKYIYESLIITLKPEIEILLYKETRNKGQDFETLKLNIK